MSKRPQDSDVEFIQALAELLRANDLTEIEVNREYGADDSLTVRVARQIVQAAPAPVHLPVAVAGSPAPGSSTRIASGVPAAMPQAPATMMTEIVA